MENLSQHRIVPKAYHVPLLLIGQKVMRTRGMFAGSKGTVTAIFGYRVRVVWENGVTSSAPSSELFTVERTKPEAKTN
jgi:hypothetical protein